MAARRDNPKVITEIRPLAADANMRQVRVGNRRVATLRAADVDSLRLRVGQGWTDSLRRDVERALEMNKARRTAMSLLGRRGRSRAELIERLEQRGHPSAIAERIVEEMERHGWLNERVYAEEVVKGTLRRGPAARRLLEARLRRRGIDPETADRTLRETEPQQSDGDRALLFARQRLSRMEGAKPEVARRRLAGALARRGFDQETITTTLEALRLDQAAMESNDA